MIHLPNNKEMTLNQIIKDLEKDKVVLKNPNNNITQYLNKFLTSFLQINIIANRQRDMSNLKLYYETVLTDIINKKFIEDNLKDVRRSSEIIIDNIKKGNRILIVSDYDVDGVTSAAVSHLLLEKLFGYDNFEVIVNRRSDGNGINDKLKNMIINVCDNDTSIGLMITSDHGSHDRNNLTEIKEVTGIDIIVTDHHLFEKDEAPFNMDAFINPHRWETDLKHMSGAGIVYFTLLHAYMELNKGLNSRDESIVYYLLTYIGLTIISDCMDLSVYINRKIVIKTLITINTSNIEHTPFWKGVIKQIANSYVINETTLSYKVIPPLNSPGRMSDARLSYELLVAKDDEYFKHFYTDIQNLNDSRKDKQTKAVDSTNKVEYDDGIVKVLLIEDSDGVQGIIANNIMFDEGYKVVICFTKSSSGQNDILLGSGRAQDENINLKDLIESIEKKSDYIISFGGHSQAIGIKIKDNLKEFFNDISKELKTAKVEMIETVHIDDYIYSMKKLILNIFDVIELGPYGVGYDRPLFASDFVIKSYRIYGKTKKFLSMKVLLTGANSTISAFYPMKGYEYDEYDKMLKMKVPVRLVYSFNVNTYMNQNKIQLNVEKLIFKDV